MYGVHTVSKFGDFVHEVDIVEIMGAVWSAYGWPSKYQPTRGKRQGHAKTFCTMALNALTGGTSNVAILAGSSLLGMAENVGMHLGMSSCCIACKYLAHREQHKDIFLGHCHASECPTQPAACSPKQSLVDCLQLSKDSAGLLDNLVVGATLPTCIQENFIPPVSDLGGRIIHSLQCTQAREDS